MFLKSRKTLRKNLGVYHFSRVTGWVLAALLKTKNFEGIFQPFSVPWNFESTYFTEHFSAAAPTITLDMFKNVSDIADPYFVNTESYKNLDMQNYYVSLFSAWSFPTFILHLVKTVTNFHYHMFKSVVSFDSNLRASLWIHILLLSTKKVRFDWSKTTNSGSM